MKTEVEQTKPGARSERAVTPVEMATPRWWSRRANESRRV